MEEQNILNSLAANYGFDYQDVCYYAKALLYYDFVRNGEQELFFECLEMVLQSVFTFYFKKEAGQYLEFDFLDEEYIVSDALYRTYGDLALPYVDDNYLEFNSYRL